MTDNHIKINDTQPWISHAGDGAATAFTIPFPFLSDTDLRVWLDGTLQTVGADFTLSGAGETAGGQVTFTTAPDEDTTIVVARQMDIARTSDFLAGSALRAAALNTELDRLTLMGQDLEAADQRSLRAPAHDVDLLSELPASADRAGRLLSFDADGHPEAGPPRSDVDLVNQITSAEAGAIAAATSAEAAAASAATLVAGIDSAEIQASQQAALRAAPPVLPVTFPGVPVLAHHRENLIFTPGSNGEMHMYRPTDSGAWHINGSSAYEQWFDLSLLGIGQEFKAAVRHGGSGSIVISPGTDHAGNDNLIGPFAAGENIRIHEGEAIVVIVRSTSGDGGFIGEAAIYAANPKLQIIGSTHCLAENARGLFDGDSQYNLLSGFRGISLPSGYRFDTGNFRLSYPSFSFAAEATGNVFHPRVQLADKEYEVSFTVGTDFAIGDTLSANDPVDGTLRVDHITHDGKLGLTLLTGSEPVVTDTLTDGTNTADIVGVTDLTSGDLPGGIIAFTAHNPNTETLDLRVHWHNLEAY